MAFNAAAASDTDRRQKDVGEAPERAPHGTGPAPRHRGSGGLSLKAKLCLAGRHGAHDRT